VWENFELAQCTHGYSSRDVCSLPLPRGTALGSEPTDSLLLPGLEGFLECTLAGRALFE